jgi:non-ribosomal peptide synthetase component F
MRVLFTITLAAACHSFVIASEPDKQALEAEARDLASQFVGQLKPQLKQALGEGGPTRAIEVCAGVAPGIADALSAQSGWTIKRVSLKSRNASRAMPDPWEQQVLEQFDRRQAVGEAAAGLSYGEVANGRYRYMQAQGVEAVCLLCHGQELSQPVRATLEQYYPDDWATGYSLGQVRGAISLSKNL